jgi:hypothetical protein
LDLTCVITWYIVFLISFIASNTRAVWFASILIGLALSVGLDDRLCDIEETILMTSDSTCGLAHEGRVCVLSHDLIYRPV